MQDQLSELTKTLINIYNQNLNFLNQNYPEIFEKIHILSKNIEKGNYKEKYSLEYKDEGYFDIYNHEKEDYIYGFNSYIEADKRKDLTNLTTAQSINLLRINSETNEFAQMETLGKVNPLVNFINNYIKPDNITFSKIYKFIFIGVGSGIHIHEIYKKLNPMNILIIEPNIELFRLSLFLIDYSIFTKGNKELFLSIGDNRIERYAELLEFHKIHSYVNYNIKHHLFHPEYHYILEEIISFFMENNPASFSYSALLQVYYRTLTYMKDKNMFLKSKLIEENSPLKDKPILLISAGPSLDSKLNWIYENQNKFIIIAVDVIIRKLEKNQIVPDIAVSADPSHLCAKYLTTEDKNYLKKSVIIFLSQQHPETIDATSHLNTYFSQAMAISRELDYTIVAPNVGTFSFAIAIALGAKKLYLIGNDAAFNQETGSRYATDSTHTQVENLDEQIKSNIITRKDIIEVKGNLKDKVKTTRDLLNFKTDYEGFIHISKHIDYEAYNLSDGAYIEGLIPLDNNDIDLGELSEKNFNPKEELNKCSIIVTDVDFKNDTKILNNIILNVKKFKKTQITTKDQLMREKFDIIIYILNKKKELESLVLSDIFLKFLDLIDIYINFILNVKNDEMHSRKNLILMKNFWSDALISLLKDMKKTIL